MDELLLHRAKGGDADAFEELITPHEKKIYATCLRMMGNPQDAFDCTQETMLRAYRTLASYRGEAKFETWLYRVAYNICLDALRGRKRRAAESIEALAEEGFSPVDTGKGPYEALEEKDRMTALSGAIAALPQDMREMVVLRQVQQLSYEDISEVTGLPLGTVKSRINRARLRLKELLLPQRELFSDSGVQISEGRAKP